jgi:dienelactone hydrolase
LIKYIIVFFYLIFLDVSAAEYLKFNSKDKNFPNHPEVLVEISFPKKFTGKLPIIITQHGSTRDGKKIKDGAIDEYSKRIIEEGIKQGFAVAAIDAFYKKDIKPTDKTIFPNAVVYANNLRKILSEDGRFDKNNIFYTGFSYGAEQVLKTIGAPFNNENPKSWKAIVAAEPGCNSFHQPVKLNFPMLIIKGEESHYYIEPCKILEKELLKKDNNVSLVVLPKANHYFSTNGKIGKGIAVNGCRYNPIIRKSDGTQQMYDGSKILKKEARRKCLTSESGKGKNRKKLNKAVKLTVDFFKNNLN